MHEPATIPRMARVLEGERRQHRQSLDAWSMVLKGVACMAWIGGLAVVISGVAGMVNVRRSMTRYGVGPPVEVLGASIVIWFVLVVVFFFAVGAFFWAVGLVLTSCGLIEENTRLAAQVRDDESKLHEPHRG